MALDRRSFIKGVCAPIIGAVASTELCGFSEADPWTTSWDQRLLQSFVARIQPLYDPAARAVRLTSSSGLYGDILASRSAVYPIRESLVVAALLLEEGTPNGVSTAHAILDRVLFNPKGNLRQRNGLVAQWVDSDSTLPDADTNMKSFNMSFALCIFFRRRDRLKADLQERLLQDLSRISRLVMLRNVNVYYTNIALLDLFILLAASEIQRDSDIRSYAEQRASVVSAAILSSKGGFAEFLSPTYTSLDVMTTTFMTMFLRDANNKDLAIALHDKLWKHIANHWHVPTRQMAGPMARTYGDRWGAQLWLQKALHNRLPYRAFYQLDSSTFNFGLEWSTPLLDYSCPAELRDRFTVLNESRVVREVFCSSRITQETGKDGPPGVRPVQGTSYLTPQFALSTVNQSDFWSQRRPMLLYWGQAISPGVGKVQVLKDGQDFASAQFYSVQDANSVLALINFVSPGGDTTPGSSGLPDPFPLRSLKVQFSVSHWVQPYQLMANGQTLNSRTFGVEALPAELPMRVSWETGNIHCCLAIGSAAFGKSPIRYAVSKQPTSFNISVSLFSRDQSEMVSWKDFQRAYLVFALTVEAATGRLAAFDDRKSKQHPLVMLEGGVGKFEYEALRLRGSVAVGSAVVGAQAFREQLDGNDVPLTYL